MENKNRLNYFINLSTRIQAKGPRVQAVISAKGLMRFRLAVFTRISLLSMYEVNAISDNGAKSVAKAQCNPTIMVV